MAKKLLHVQKYLRSGKTPSDLKEELGIKFFQHPRHPLTGFKYCQIDSPRQHPIVRECRGLVLEEGTWNIAAKAFDRFFNVGELEHEFKLFNWSDFHTHSKEDGSLILLYNYKGEWCVNTSGSFGLGELDIYGGTWQDLFWETAPFTIADLKCVDPAQTLVFELCTPYNKIVRPYKPTVFLLGIFDHRWQHEGRASIEFSPRLTTDIADHLKVKRPERYDFSSQEEIREFLLRQEEEDTTFEGVILCDSNGLRYKWKTQTYLSLHRMKDNGNVLHPKNIVPIILANEQHEVIAVMPECTSAFKEVEAIMGEAFASLKEHWLYAQKSSSQKEFALKVKDNMMAPILFNLRKQNPNSTVEDLSRVWRKSGDQIIKRLFDKKRFKFDIIKI